LSESARELHTATVNDRDLIPVGDEIGDRLAGRMQDLLILKGGTA
jgi:hypothetical protein